MPPVTPKKSSSNDDVTVKFGSDTRDLEKGVERVRKATKGTLDAFNDVAIGAVGVSEKVQTGFRRIGDAFSKVGTVLKRVLIGGLFLFALTAAKVFATVRDSIAGAVELAGGDTKERFDALKGTLTEIKAALGAAFLPILQAALPYLQRFADWLLVILNRAAQIVAAFLGQKQALQIIPGSAAKLAKETEKAKKSAEGALAAFDQINVLAQQTGATDISDLPKVEAQMVPITDDILKRVQEIKDAIMAWWKDPLGMLRELWGRIADWFKTNVFDPIAALWRNLWNAPESKDSAVAGIQAAFGILPVWMYNNVMLPIADFFKTNWETIVSGATVAILGILASWSSTVEKIQELWNSAREWFFSTILQPLRDGFGLALNWIGDKFRDVFTGVQNFVYNTLNKILGFINDVINTILAGIASVLSAASAISGAFNIPSVRGGISTAIGGLLSNFSVPRLATGAIIPGGAPFAAVLGDQPAGKTNVEAPADLIRQIVREEIGEGGFADITLMLDGEPIYRNQQRIARRHGKSLISSGRVE